MQRIATLFVDHFGWGTMDEPKTIDFFEKLGFYMGDKRPEGNNGLWMSHYYFDEDSSYINIYQLPEDGHAWPCTLNLVYDESIPPEERLSNPMGVTGVYTFVVSTGDVDASRAAAINAGYEVCPAYRRGKVGGEDSYYAKMGGCVTTDMYAIKCGVEPFPTMMVGFMEHCDEHHQHLRRKNIHEYHPNGVNKISSLVLYYETEDELMSAYKGIHKMHDAMKDTADDSGYYTSVVRLIDKQAYAREFGVEPSGIRSNVVGVTFKNGDMDYIREAAEKAGFRHFEKNGKLYVDGRDALNAFLIFEE